jgi:hypothetical protein
MIATDAVVGRAIAPPRARGAHCADGDAGMVVVEAAVALPLLLAIAVCLAWALSLASTSIALGDTARLAARDLARGTGVDAAVAAAGQRVPGSSVTVDTSGSDAVVVAAKTVAIPAPILDGISVDLVQRVAVPREWGR